MRAASSSQGPQALHVGRIHGHRLDDLVLRAISGIPELDDGELRVWDRPLDTSHDRDGVGLRLRDRRAHAAGRIDGDLDVRLGRLNGHVDRLGLGDAPTWGHGEDGAAWGETLGRRYRGAE